MKNLLLTIFGTLILCSSTILAQSLTVWPGDVDNNGQVTNVDVLYLGLGFDKTGPFRDTANAGILWTPKQALSWNSFIIDTTLNGAYADCNGDGVVDTVDLGAIEQNYLLTNGGALRPDSFLVGTPNSPPLFFETSLDTIFEGMGVSLNINLGSTQLPVDSFFGISFSIEFDTDLVTPGSWTALAASNIAPTFNTELTFLRELYDSSRVDIAYSLTPLSTGNTSVPSDSTILALSFIIEDNLIGIAQLDSTFDLRLRNVTLIDASGNRYATNPIALSLPLKLADTTVGINELESKLKVYPNPAQGQLYLSGINNIEQIQITDLTGAIVLNQITNGGSDKQVLNTETLTNGMYLLNVSTSKGIIRKKILIAR